MLLRYALPEDMDDICRIWHSSFGDSEDFVRTFFDKTNILSTTVVAEFESRVQALMCAFDGIGDMSYLYALCTAQEYRGRGIGGTVLRESMRLAFQRGAQMVCLHPADASLAKWYETGFGMRSGGYFVEEQFTPGDTALSAREVPFSRLAAADGHLTTQLCSAQETIARFYGGVLLEIGKCLLYAEKRSGTVTVKAVAGHELSAFSECDIISAAANYFSVDKLIIRRYLKEQPAKGTAYYVNLLVKDGIAPFTPDNYHFGFQYPLD